MNEIQHPRGLAQLFDELATLFDGQLAQSRWPRTRRGEREPIHPLIRRAVFERDGRACVSCGIQLTLRTAQLDHIVPWSARGTDYSDNLRILCEPCNTDRSNFHSSLDWSMARRPHVTFRCVNCAPADDYGPEMLRAFCVECGIVAPAWEVY